MRRNSSTKEKCEHTGSVFLSTLVNPPTYVIREHIKKHLAGKHIVTAEIGLARRRSCFFEAVLAEDTYPAQNSMPTSNDPKARQ